MLKTMTEVENKLVLCPHCMNYREWGEFVIAEADKVSSQKNTRNEWWYAHCRRCRANDRGTERTGLVHE